MPSFDINQLFFIIPEIFLLSGIIIILLIDLFVSEKFKQVSYYLSQITLLITAILSFSLLTTNEIVIFDGSFIIDRFATVFKISILIFTIIFMLYSRYYLLSQKLFKSEYLILVLFATFGMMIMSSGYSLLTIYLGLEILSLSMYSIIAMANTRFLAIEAALKYFVLGAIASGILLYGISMLYGISSSLNIADISTFVNNNPNTNDVLILNFSLVFLIIGIAFKLGAAPFHMWVPDVYHGSTTSTTMFLSSMPKIATVAMLVRLLIEGMSGMSHYWSELLIFLGIASIVIGTLVALVQTNIKRLLAYSTIAHIGFILIAFSLQTNDGYAAGVFYTWAYVLTSLAAFGVIIALGSNKLEVNNISDLAGLGKTNPWFALMLLIIMFSMAGIPPFIGLYAKLFVLNEVINNSYLYLATTIVIFAVIGAYYYLQIVRVMYFDNAIIKDNAILAPISMQILLTINSILILMFGIFPSYFINLAHSLF